MNEVQKQLIQEVEEKARIISGVLDEIASNELGFSGVADYDKQLVWPQQAKAALREAFKAGWSAASTLSNKHEIDLYQLASPTRVAIVTYACRHTLGRLVWLPDHLTVVAKAEAFRQLADADLVEWSDGCWRLTEWARAAAGG